MQTLKALSLWQPWPWLICHPEVLAACDLPAKKIENRKWYTSYRGDLLIHAGTTLDADLFTARGKLRVDYWLYKFGNKRGQALYNAMPQHAQDYPRGAIVGKATLTTIVTNSPNPWFHGPYGFVLSQATTLVPITYPGKYNIFDVTLPPEAIKTKTDVSQNEEEENENRVHTIYTIGYGIEAIERNAARRQVEAFMKQGGLLIDIRHIPYSKTFADWNRERLLAAYQMRYLHITELGNLHHHTGKAIKLVDEESGLQQLENWLTSYDILLLCGCHRAEECHRGYIAERLAARTHSPVCHLQVPNSLQSKPRLPRGKNQPAQIQDGLRTLELWGPGEV